MWLPEAHALAGTLIPLQGAAGSGSAQTPESIADQPPAARASFSPAWDAEIDQVVRAAKQELEDRRQAAALCRP